MLLQIPMKSFIENYTDMKSDILLFYIFNAGIPLHKLILINYTVH